jgi:hypothetical protein
MVSIITDGIRLRIEKEKTLPKLPMATRKGLSSTLQIFGHALAVAGDVLACDHEAVAYHC